MSLKIIGTGRFTPVLSVTNFDLEKILETNDEWITTRTGIKSRYISSGESITDLAVGAAKKALKSAALAASELDLILCSTIMGEYLTPSLACCVQHDIGAACPAYDLNAACSGFIYALDTADAYISSGKAKNILIVSAEMMSCHVDWNDRRTCVLFGDGAGACVVTRGEALKYIRLIADGNSKALYRYAPSGNNPFDKTKTDENGVRMLPQYLYMDGQEVFKFAVSTIEREITTALESLNLLPSDIDCYLLHQANKRIIDFAITRLKLPSEKFPVNIDHAGNISSATIPVLLDELLEGGKIKNGDLLLMNAFGAGFTGATCVIEWNVK